MSGPDDTSVAESLPHVERRLAAILSADVKEYSRLMGADDVATVEMLTAYRKAMTALISQHRGRVVDAPGDNLLAEFSSVVDAVQCSVSIQEELNARNADLPVDRRRCGDLDPSFQRFVASESSHFAFRLHHHPWPCAHPSVTGGLGPERPPPAEVRYEA